MIFIFAKKLSNFLNEFCTDAFYTDSLHFKSLETPIKPCHFSALDLRLYVGFLMLLWGALIYLVEFE